MSARSAQRNLELGPPLDALDCSVQEGVGTFVVPVTSPHLQ